MIEDQRLLICECKYSLKGILSWNSSSIVMYSSRSWKALPSPSFIALAASYFPRSIIGLVFEGPKLSMSRPPAIGLVGMTKYLY